MRKISLFYRIILLFAFAILPILYFGGGQLYTAYQAKNEAAIVEVLAEVAPVFSDLTHALQNERGLSAGLIGSKNASFQGRLKEYRLKADEAINQYKKVSAVVAETEELDLCLLYTSPSPRDQRGSRMPSSA